MNTTFKKESITYASDRNGKDTSFNVVYTLYFDEQHKLIEVRNQFGHTIEQKGEVWEFFDGKYNNL